MRFLLHMISSIMKFITINYGFFANLLYSPFHFDCECQMKHREALKFITIPPQVLHLKILWGRKWQKWHKNCVILQSWLCMFRRLYIKKTTRLIRLNFGVWTDLRQVGAQAKFQPNRLTNGRDRAAFHLTFACFSRRS